MANRGNRRANSGLRQKAIRKSVYSQMKGSGGRRQLKAHLFRTSAPRKRAAHQRKKMR